MHAFLSYHCAHLFALWQTIYKILLENEKYLKMCATRLIMSITGAMMNLPQRMATVRIRNLIAFFIILLHGETYGKYLEVRLNQFTISS